METKATIPSDDGKRPEAAFDDADRVYVLEDQVGHLLRKAHQRATTIFQSLMEKSELTPLQFAALVKVRDEGSVSQNSLGRLTGMDPATIMGVVQRLHKRGFIRRVADPQDKRRTRCLLTAKGLAAVEEWEKVGFVVSTEILSPLDARERETFLVLLSRLT
jgi:DNA-binding MarR family transcriptional regulator